MQNWSRESVFRTGEFMFRTGPESLCSELVQRVQNWSSEFMFRTGPESSCSELITIT